MLTNPAAQSRALFLLGSHPQGANPGRLVDAREFPLLPQPYQPLTNRVRVVIVNQVIVLPFRLDLPVIETFLPVGPSGNEACMAVPARKIHNSPHPFPKDERLGEPNQHMEMIRHDHKRADSYRPILNAISEG